MSEDVSGGPPIETVKDLFADKYQIVEKLDWNGLALVFRAEHGDGAPVALAVLPIDTEGSPETTEFFKRKAAELQLLVEPGIVRVTGHGIQHGVAYLELEYRDATTLADELQDGPLERDQVLSFTGELLDILGQAHAGGHFHWDLTPNNILLAPGTDGSEHVSVLGFGIQEIVRGARTPGTTTPTGRGSGPEAARYIAPELRDVGAADARADVYGVAALVHHMLTGSPPGPSSTAPPDDLAAALAHGMAEDPANRPVDAATFGFTLAEGAAGRTGEAPSFAPPAASMPVPFSAPALEPMAPSPGPSPFPAEAEATVVDARALSEEDFQAPVVAAMPSIAETAPLVPATPSAPAERYVPPPEPAPALVAPAIAPAEVYESLPPAEVYESLAPAVAAPAAPPVDANLGAAASPPTAPAVSSPPAATALDPFGTQPNQAEGAATPVAGTQPQTSGPARDPFGAPPPSAYPPAASHPYDGAEFAEEEKKRGSFVVAILFLALALGLAAAFFIIRGTGSSTELPTNSEGTHPGD